MEKNRSLSRLGLFGIILLQLFSPILGHVKLTFPPARFPDLDFLDNYRTPAPCGVPKPGPSGLRTTLQAGSRINITWFMPYPHKGGFRIELMNQYDQPFQVLTPIEQDYIGTEDQTVQHYSVELPYNECKNCGIRLLRQAEEWTASYQFWSCADVDILESVPLELRCSGHGSLLRGECRCEKFYHGSQCQLQNECEGDEDCGSNGVCVEKDTVQYPRKVCYCKEGYFGDRCSRFSELRSRNFDPSEYQLREVGADRNKIYWKILPESKELEVILQYPSTSWAGIGWRPSGIDAKQCTSIKKLPGYSEAEVEPLPEIATGAEPEPEPEGEIEAPYPEPEPEGEDSAGELEPEGEGPPPVVPRLPPRLPTTGAPPPEPEPSSKPAAPIPEPEASPAPAAPGGVIDVGLVTAQIGIATTEQPEIAEEEIEPVGSEGATVPAAPPPTAVESEEPEEYAEVIGESCYGDWRWPINCRNCDYRVSWSYIEDTDEMEFSLETKAPTNWWTGIGFSRSGGMSDADMIVVKSRSGRMSLHDMFSTGYSEPAEDRQQDVYTPTIVGTHVNGVLRATFTRLRNTNDVTDDVKFGDSDEECYYFLFPVSGGRINPDGSIQQHRGKPAVSRKKVCIRSCLGSSEEASESSPTGLANDGPVEQACETEFRFPTGCEGASCDYHAKWNFDIEQGDVRFEISAKELGRWTGIGFSRDGNMTNSDIYTGWMYEDRAYITDRFAFGRQLPAIDPPDRQDIYDIGGKVEDDIQTIWFRRKALTEDSFSDYPLTECYYFLFPIGGGRVLARNAEDFKDPRTPIGFHDLYRPRVSRERICICAPIPAEGVEEIPEGATLLETRRKRQAGQAEPEPEPVAHPESEPEPESEGSAVEGLHPMDCMDMVIGSANGGLSRIEDFYSLSRATPRKDEFFGGRQSITAAMGFEEDGVTTIMFRKKLEATDSTADHSIMPGDMQVIWAKGQERGLYSHTPASALESGAVGRPNFYGADVLKYHGSKNRGTMLLDFFSRGPTETPFCEGTFLYPDGCEGGSCSYQLSYNRDSKGVHFYLDAKVPLNRWSGVGFSKDGAMRNSDMILAVVSQDGNVEVTDRFATGYLRPVQDQNQDIFNIDFQYRHGRLRARFSRSLTTPDNATDVDLADCVYFIYPHTGGMVVEGTTQIRKHIDTPRISSQPICLDGPQCSDPSLPQPEPEGTPESKPEPEGKPEYTVPDKKPAPEQPDVKLSGGTGLSKPKPTKYILTLHLLNEEWNENLRNPSTVEYGKLSDKVIGVVDGLLKKNLKGYSSSRVINFKEEGVAEVEVVAEGHSGVEILDVITPAASSGTINGLQIDSDRTKIRTASTSPTPEQIRNWIIIGVACFLVLVAILFAVCIILRTKRHKSRDLRAVKSRYVPFAPYSYLMSNGYPGTYPAGGYGYPGGPLPDKGAAAAGYDPNMYPGAADYGRAMSQAGGHNRQYSNATTATPAHGKSPSPETASDSDGAPKSGGKARSNGASGSSETTYGEWMNKVSSSQEPGVGGGRAQGKGKGGKNEVPYVSYPNDPYSYYTLNGNNRAFPRAGPSANPAGGYYRPY